MNFKRTLIIILVILIIIFLILISFLIKDYWFTKVENRSDPIKNTEDNNNQIFNLNKENTTEQNKEDIYSNNTLNNLNKLKLALFLYLKEHHYLPDELTDLKEEYLSHIPVETVTGKNDATNKLDLTGGWYYNPEQINDFDVTKIIDKVLKPNINSVQKSRREFTPYHIMVNRSKHKLYIIQNNRKIKSYPIVVGGAESPTPVGEFRIKNKVRLTGKQKKIYGQYWIGIDLWTKGGSYGIHGITNTDLDIVEQYSKGCIRMKNKDLKQLYDFIPIKTKIVIK
ncbi:hypothetical protein JCM16358_01970 [Halanaerocella petrolearia]